MTHILKILLIVGISLTISGIRNPQFNQMGSGITLITIILIISFCIAHKQTLVEIVQDLTNNNH